MSEEGCFDDDDDDDDDKSVSFGTGSVVLDEICRTVQVATQAWFAPTLASPSSSSDDAFDADVYLRARSRLDPKLLAEIDASVAERRSFVPSEASAPPGTLLERAARAVAPLQGLRWHLRGNADEWVEVRCLRVPLRASDATTDPDWERYRRDLDWLLGFVTERKRSLANLHLKPTATNNSASSAAKKTTASKLVVSQWKETTTSAERERLKKPSGDDGGGDGSAASFATSAVVPSKPRCVFHACPFPVPLGYNMETHVGVGLCFDSVVPNEIVAVGLAVSPAVRLRVLEETTTSVTRATASRARVRLELAALRFMTECGGAWLARATDPDASTARLDMSGTLSLRVFVEGPRCARAALDLERARYGSLGDWLRAMNLAKAVREGRAAEESKDASP